MKILFIIYSSRLASTLSTIRAGTARAVRENVYEETDEDYTYLEKLAGYHTMHNPFEETIFAIFGSNKVKTQHEKMKLENERLKHLKTRFVFYAKMLHC